MLTAERYVKPVSGYALHSHVTNGRMLLERANCDARALAFVPFPASHLRRVAYNNGKRNHLRRRCRYHAFMQNGTVRASCVRSNGERRLAKRFILRHIALAIHVIRGSIRNAFVHKALTCRSSKNLVIF